MASPIRYEDRHRDRETDRWGGGTEKEIVDKCECKTWPSSLYPPAVSLMHSHTLTHTHMHTCIHVQELQELFREGGKAVGAVSSLTSNSESVDAAPLQALYESCKGIFHDAKVGCEWQA